MPMGTVENEIRDVKESKGFHRRIRSITMFAHRWASKQRVELGVAPGATVKETKGGLTQRVTVSKSKGAKPNFGT